MALRTQLLAAGLAGLAGAAMHYGCDTSRTCGTSVQVISKVTGDSQTATAVSGVSVEFGVAGGAGQLPGQTLSRALTTSPIRESADRKTPQKNTRKQTK